MQEGAEGDIKRLFFGLEVQAPWPEGLPSGRALGEGHRHLTLAFLGNTSYSRLTHLLPMLPSPVFRVGPVGIFNTCLFLPEKDPRVVAWHVQWLEDHAVESYQEVLCSWLSGQGYDLENRPFLAHVTVARPPFVHEEWRQSFKPLPMMISGLHLYESVGNLRYEPRWSMPLLRPFEEIEHEGHVHLMVRGIHMAQLQTHAQVALAFKCPELATLLPAHPKPLSLEEVVANLNRMIIAAGQEVSLPFRTVTSHGRFQKADNGCLEWEMILE